MFPLQPLIDYIRGMTGEIKDHTPAAQKKHILDLTKDHSCVVDSRPSDIVHNIYRGFTALHYAAHSNLLEAFTVLDGIECDILTQEDCDVRTRNGPLHITKGSSALEIAHLCGSTVIIDFCKQRQRQTQINKFVVIVKPFIDLVAAFGAAYLRNPNDAKVIDLSTNISYEVLGMQVRLGRLPFPTSIAPDPVAAPLNPKYSIRTG